MDHQMTVSFQSALHELADVAIRSLKQQGTFDRQRRDYALVSGIFGLVFPFALLSVFSVSMELKLIISVLVALIAGIQMLLTFPRMIENRMRQYYRKQMATPNTFPVQVMIDKDGITFSQLGIRTTYEWAMIRRMERLDYGIDIEFANGELATVRARAFESPAKEQEFQALAESYLNPVNPSSEPSLSS